MITFTSIMGLAAGVGLILLPMMMFQLYRNRIQSFDGWALNFGGLALTLLIFGGYMSLTWPLKDPEKFKNFMFGELTFLMGILLLITAIFLWKRGDTILEKREQAVDYLFQVAQPLSVFVFAVGLALLMNSIGAIQYKVFSFAPPQEPILGTWPRPLVNFILCSLYVIPTIGCLLTLPAVYMKSHKLMKIACSTWLITGIGWLIVATVVYYTHIAMDFNFRAGL